MNKKQGAIMAIIDTVIVIANEYLIIIISVMELGQLLARSGLTYPEVFSKVFHDSSCHLGSFY